MPLFELGANQIKPIPGTTFAAASIREREDLQRLLRSQVDIIAPNSMVLDEEFSDWDDSKRRIDLLVLDQDANLVVVELKRTEDGGHMELQAIRYAAMVSTMPFQQAVEAHGRFIAKQGIAEDPRSRILDFLEWDEPKDEDFAQDVRIVLVSADFSKEVTTSALWLNERGVDIRCVRMCPYRYGDATLLDIQQIIPLTEADEYQIRVREKAKQERVARKDNTERSDRHIRFWASLLKKANAMLPLHQNVASSRLPYVSATSHGLQYNYVVGKQVGRVELYICRPDKEANKAIFDNVLRSRQEIEAGFGGPLSWQRRDDRNICRISTDIASGRIEDESTWDVLQDDMIEAMRKLEAALRPYVKKYREGGQPEPIGD